MYGQFTFGTGPGVITFTVTVTSGGSLVLGTLIFAGPNYARSIGDVIATLDSGVLGSAPGTAVTVTVSGVVQATPTAIDLTKSVNKLTDGDYTLANGVEGQILYLVRQTGATFDSHTVTVANARIEGVMQTDIPFSPFASGTDPTNMATLIFTDSAWQNMGGVWNLT
jgi:hypothetical protein